MSKSYDLSSITVAATGATIVTSGTSARVAIPVMSSGELPRYIRVAAINACYVRMGVSTINAVTTDTLVQPADSVIMHVPGGITHIAAIQDASAGKVNITPLENM